MKAVEENSAHICKRTYTWYLGKHKQTLDCLSRVWEGSPPKLRFSWNSLPQGLCYKCHCGSATQCCGPEHWGNAVPPAAAPAGICPPPSPGCCHREETESEAGRDWLLPSHNWGQTWSAQPAEGLRDRWEQDPTTRPMEEEVGRSQKGEEKGRCLFVHLVFAFKERRRVQWERRVKWEGSEQFQVQG